MTPQSRLGVVNPFQNNDATTSRLEQLARILFQLTRQHHIKLGSLPS